ncbi:MAG: ribosome maturation factor RimP [Firmicutes bacterium]|nr:ribosome maturation factor RimP [Bacillota bacterium]MDH7495503.1 ribosome maturation factor RimP [Bacillota bacterium]
MKPQDIENLVTDILRPMVDGRGIELVDVEYVREGGQWYLRVYIDRPEGVSMDDCEWVNNELGGKLDELDPIPQSYVLEVSSSGEKPLRRESDYERFRGRMVLVSTYAPVEGRKSFEGRLLGLVDGKVRLDVEGRTFEVPRDKISHARLVVEI